MTPNLLETKDLDKSFDGVRALDGFSCAVHQGEVVGLIGPNGAGKTTLFNVLSGLLPADGGAAVFQGRKLLGMRPHKIAGLSLTRTFQRLRLVRQMTVLDNLLLAFRGQPGERLDNVFLRSRRCAIVERGNLERARSFLEDAGLSAKAADLADALSYGQQKLLSIMMCLAADAKLLLLDEPVAGISPEMKERILGIVKGLPGRGKSVVLIEHDMEAIASVCSRVIFMDAGRKVCEGTPEEVRNDPRVIEAYLE